MTLSLGAPGAALAQPADVHANAEEQFRQGREAMNQGDCKRAITLFRASQELEPGRGKLLNMAICEEQLGALAAALQHFQELLPQLQKGDERLTITKQHIAQLDKKVGRLRLSLAPWAPEGSRVAVDGVPVDPAKLGADLPVDGGKHVISVTVNGASERRYDATVEPAARVTLVVEPGDAPAPRKDAPAIGSPPEAPRADEPVNGKRAAGIAVVGIGALGLGAGAVTGVLALAKHSKAEDACPKHVGCAPDVIATASAGKTLSIVSTVAFVTGVAGAGVGTWLLVTSRKSKPNVSVTAAPLPGGGWLSVGGVL